MFEPGDHVVDHVDAYVHGALAFDDARYVEDHIEECRVCQVAVDEARKRAATLLALPPIEAPERLLQATERRIAAASHVQVRLTPRSVMVVAATAAILFLTAFTIYFAVLSPSPYDLLVLGQREWLGGSEPAIRVVVVVHRDGRPVEGVPVRIELADEPRNEVVQLADFTTDRLGSAEVQVALPDWREGEYRLRVEARPRGGRELIERTITLKRSWQLMLSTDKPVYQPGQTIRVRSLGLARPDLKPVAGQDVVFSVVDPKGNVIFRHRDVTSRFGIASIECPLAVEILNGPYEVVCSMGDTIQRTTVEVKRYVLPKFRIETTLDAPFYRPGDRVQGTVRARYFFGKPVVGGEVTLDVQVIDVGPQSIYHSTVTTEADGTATFEFRLPEMLVGRQQYDGGASFTLSAIVRDTAGQEQSAHLTRVVTAEPIRIEVIPEGGSLVPGLANTVYVLTTYPDGQPAECRVLVSGIQRELATNRAGVASFEVKPRSRETRWTVRATDAEGRTTRREFHFGEDHPGADFLLRTDRAVYEGGQTVRIVALGGGVQPIFLDLIKDGQTMLTQSIEISAGRGQYEFDLPPELFGTIELYAYRFNSAGFPVGKRQVVYVHQAGTLRINAHLDREVYRPGERARVTFQLEDAEGQPSPGAISLAAVDEAVFSVLPVHPGMEQPFFTLDQ